MSKFIKLSVLPVNMFSGDDEVLEDYASKIIINTDEIREVWESQRHTLISNDGHKIPNAIITLKPYYEREFGRYPGDHEHYEPIWNRFLVCGESIDSLFELLSK